MSRSRHGENLLLGAFAAHENGPKLTERDKELGAEPRKAARLDGRRSKDRASRPWPLPSHLATADCLSLLVCAVLSTDLARCPGECL